MTFLHGGIELRLTLTRHWMNQGKLLKCTAEPSMINWKQFQLYYLAECQLLVILFLEEKQLEKQGAFSTH